MRPPGSFLPLTDLGLKQFKMLQDESEFFDELFLLKHQPTLPSCILDINADTSQVVEP